MFASGEWMLLLGNAVSALSDLRGKIRRPQREFYLRDSDWSLVGGEGKRNTVCFYLRRGPKTLLV